MNILHSAVEITEWERWADPGDYPSAMGGSPLADGALEPAEVRGYVVARLEESDMFFAELNEAFYGEWQQEVKPTSEEFFEMTMVFDFLIVAKDPEEVYVLALLREWANPAMRELAEAPDCYSQAREWLGKYLKLEE